MDRRLLALIGGCALDCSKTKWFFCDPNTGNCEPCIDICLPSRGTRDECREQILCKDMWNMLDSTTPDRDAPATSAAAAAASRDIPLIVASSILVFLCVVAVASLVVVLNRRRLQARDRRRAERDVIYKAPIPVSTEEQEREHLNATNENRACVDIPLEADEGRLQSLSA